MNKSLEGLIVLDLSRVLAGPFCGMVLSDLGCETIKVEIPETGDDARRFPPFVGEESAYFMSVNRNKKSMTLNLKSQEGKRLFLELVKQADIVLENYRPGTMEKLGLSYETMQKANPRIIYAACSGYGQTGPYGKRPAYDMIVQAMGGIMSITGPDKDHPTRVGSSMGDITAGLYTVIGILAALSQRERTGQGQMVDVAMLDCQFAVLENAVARYTVTGKDPEPIGNRHPSIAPFGTFECKDGPIVIAAGNDTLFAALADEIGEPALIDDSLYRTNDLRVQHVTSLSERIESMLSKETIAYWIDRFNARGIPCGPINCISDILNNPQIRARSMVVETTNKKGDRLMMPGNPIKMSESSDAIECGAPLLGEHTEQVLKERLGLSQAKIDRLRSEKII